MLYANAGLFSFSVRRRNDASCVGFQALRPVFNYAQCLNEIPSLQVEGHAEGQRQEWSAAAAEYERKLATISSELRSGSDAAER